MHSTANSRLSGSHGGAKRCKKKRRRDHECGFTPVGIVNENGGSRGGRGLCLRARSRRGRVRRAGCRLRRLRLRAGSRRGGGRLHRSLGNRCSKCMQVVCGITCNDLASPLLAIFRFFKTATTEDAVAVGPHCVDSCDRQRIESVCTRPCAIRQGHYIQGITDIGKCTIFSTLKAAIPLSTVPIASEVEECCIAVPTGFANERSMRWNWRHLRDDSVSHSIQVIV